jgi:hypothetical protein
VCLVGKPCHAKVMQLLKWNSSHGIGGTARGVVFALSTTPQIMVICQRPATLFSTLYTQHMSACSVLLLLAVVLMHATILRNNAAKLQGGAVSMGFASRLQASGCIFEGNSAFDNATKHGGTGGALFVEYNASVTLSNCTLVNNTCLRMDSAHSWNPGSGGAIAILSEAAGKRHDTQCRRQQCRSISVSGPTPGSRSCNRHGPWL